METLRKLIGNRIFLHLVFCLSIFGWYFYVNSLGFNIGGLPKNLHWIGRLSGYFFILFCIYLGRWMAMKYWFFDNPQRSFFLYALIGWCGLLAGWWAIIRSFFSPNAGFLELSIYFGPLITLAFIGGILIKIVRTSIKNQLQRAEVAAEQSKSELNILQSQLSPHFLFNTLNNLYGISIKRPEKIPPLLLKLSELLRYSVYETKELFVPLKDELEYIHNYIEFEKIRIGDRLVLNLDIENIGSQTINIAPMMLIIFIENAFKHSKNSAEEQIYIDIHLKIWANFILFSVKNSHSKSKEKSSISNKNSGFGLANLIKRLDLLYPNEHDLKVENQEDFYSVLLQLKIK